MIKISKFSLLICFFFICHFQGHKEFISKKYATKLHLQKKLFEVYLPYNFIFRSFVLSKMIT